MTVLLSASNYGGAIHVRTEDVQNTCILSFQGIIMYNSETPMIVSQTECFVHVEGSRLDMRLIFMNNTAGKGGDVLYED